MNIESMYIKNNYGLRMKDLKPSPLFKKVNLLPTSGYNKFIFDLFVELNNIFSHVIFSETNKKRYIVNDSTNNYTYTTPKIKGYIIEVNNCFELEFHPLCKGICLFTFEVNESLRGQGIGRKLMNSMIDISNKYQIPIYLIPIQTTEEVTYDTLKKFYRSFGFKKSHKSNYWIYDGPKPFLRMAA